MGSGTSAIPTGPSGQQPEPTHVRALAGALLVTVLWSSSWILVRVGLDDEDLDPLTFAGLRYSLAAILLLVWTVPNPVHRARIATLDTSMWRRLVVYGVVFFAVAQGAQFVAIDNQPAATTSLMLAPTPLLVALVAGRSIGERSTRRQVVGAVLIVVGAVVYFGGDLGATAVGMAAATIGLAANVAGSVMGRSINRDGPIAPVAVAAISMTIGAVLLLATGLALEGMPAITAKVFGIVAWLAVVNTAFAFTLWSWSQRRLAAVESAAINNTMLIQIAVLAWIFLGEAPGVAGVVGIVVVSIGAFVTTVAPAPLRRLARRHRSRA